MGGCCGCVSKRTEFHSSPPLFNYPVSEERDPLPPHHSTISVLSAVLLVDTNLDSSVPDTYRPSSGPIPYECYPRCPPASLEDQESSGNKIASADDTYSRRTLETNIKTLEIDVKSIINTDLVAVEKVEDEKSKELEKSIERILPSLQDEEDFCPTCFEEYDEENPKIITKCDHHFHLGCILEWMERSDTCPMCNQEMVFSPSKGG